MREIVLGTAGHVDHGKTSFIRALTGIETDRLKEEKKRGITIELGFAFLDLPCGHRLGIVDVPGHERFIKNMVAGAGGMDMVAFIIAADEGIMPQSREHLDICRLLGVKQGIVVLTKIDMVEEEWLELVEDEIREFVAGTFLENAPVLPVSSTTGQGIDRVKEALNDIVASDRFAEAYGPFRMPVDRIFTMKGFGSVITGTSIAGRISVGDELMLYPDRQKGKVRGIQVHGLAVDMVEAGHRTAINVQGLEKEDIHRGDMAATPGTLAPAYVFDADFLYLAANKKAFKHRTRVRVHLGTAEIMGRISLLDRDTVQPGDQAPAQVLLEEPAVAWPGDRYVVRSYSPVTTIGGGVLHNYLDKKRKRFKDEDRQQNRNIFQAFHRAEPEEMALFYLNEAGGAGLDFDALAIKTGTFGNRLKKLLEKPISTRRVVVAESDRQRMIAADVYESLQEALRARVARFHLDNPLLPGMAMEELRRALPGQVDARLFQHLLSTMGREKKIVQEDGAIHLAGHTVTLKEDQEKLRGDLTALYETNGLTPPTLKAAYDALASFSHASVKEMLDVLVRDKVLARVNESLYFSARHLETLEKRLIERLTEDEDLSPATFKEVTGASRKFSIPLLEYFDAAKITMRIGDKRVLRKRG